MDPAQQVIDDIVSLKIQGATNVAIAVLDALADAVKSRPDISCYELTRLGQRLAYARPTEPLAQNAVRYISAGCTAEVTKRIVNYQQFIEDGKRSVPSHGVRLLSDGGSYLTLCHSSTTVRLFTEARRLGAYYSLFVAETRPRLQGRITAVELLEHGFDDVTMVIDDVAVSLIEGRIGKIDAVFIGADLLTKNGFVNKVGSLAVTAAAKRRHIPVYVLSTLLKYNPGTFSQEMVETRSQEEIWADAPADLKFYAPAFDYVPFLSNVHVVCEAGVIPGNKVEQEAKKLYPFVFDSGHDKKLYYGKSL